MRGTWKLEGKPIVTLPGLAIERILALWVLAVVDRDRRSHIAVALDGENGVIRWAYAPITKLEFSALVSGGISIRDALLKDIVFIADVRSVEDAPERGWQISGADIPADILPSPDLLLPHIMAAEVQRSVTPPAGSEAEIRIDGAAVLDGGMISFEDLSNFAGRVQRLWHAIAGTFYTNNESPPQKPAGQGFTPSTLLLAGTGEGSWVAKVRPTEERMFDILLSKYKSIIEAANDNALDAALRAHGTEVYDALDSYMTFVSNRKLEVLTKSKNLASFVGPRKAAHFVKYFDARRPPQRARPQKREEVVGATFRRRGYFIGYMYLAKEFEFVGEDNVTYGGEVFDSALFPLDEVLPLGSVYVFDAVLCPVTRGNKTTHRLLSFREIARPHATPDERATSTSRTDNDATKTDVAPLPVTKSDTTNADMVTASTQAGVPSDAPTWNGPCEAMFEQLALTNPAELLTMISGGTLEYYDLTFAAEIAGRVSDSSLVVPTLLPLLSHPEPVVREGAVYGLARHMNQDIAQKIRDVASNDPSPGVRRSAVGVLEEFDNVSPHDGGEQ